MKRVLPLVFLALTACAMPDLTRIAPREESPEPLLEETAEGEAPIDEETTGTGSTLERIGDRGILEIGKSDAPHTLMIFTNISCAYCAEFFRDMLPGIEREFVDPGKLKVQIVVTPLKKYPNSLLEASAVICGGRTVHDAMLSATVRTKTALITLAKNLKVPATFSKCLDAKETKGFLAAQQEFIAIKNVTLIPTFMMGSGTLTGLPSSADLRGWIRTQING